MQTDPAIGASAKADWSPATYLKFEDERTRAARDLLAQVPLAALRKAVDVGCGPGNSTELIAERYPDAEIVGLDNSPAMLEAARKRLPRLRFEAADANVWTPGADIDLAFANATYQWIPDHLEQLGRVLRAMSPGTSLAVQMPDNLTEPTHALMRAVAEAGPWAERLKGAARKPLPPAGAYYDALAPLSVRFDIWRTVYNHPLADAAAIVEFIRSTGLRPYLDPLSDAERDDFLVRYTAEIAKAYPPRADGKVLLAFPRLFIVAAR
jgi:trans-aconitate 2-methyltransferase